MKLVEDWRRAWRWWSVRLSALGALLMGVAEVAGQSWAGLPQDVRDQVPHAQTIALVLFMAAGLARLVKQGGKDGD
ncbi:MAG: hypothetical protein WBL20_16220 [Sphingobium sp.]|uniref:DUF7940 domain-containing protein n=1 Tax=Sphingobium sp. TaxID=1912891 RepID=UPI003BB14EB2